MNACLPAEFRFLLRALRALKSGEDADKLVGAAEGLDWTAIVAGIKRHGVSWIAGPLLAEPGLIPPDSAAALRRATAAQLVATLQRSRETAHIAHALAAAGIRFLMVKGAPLSIQLYGDVSRRPSRDIDVLVEPGSAAAVETVMLRLGYYRPDGEAAIDASERVAKEVGYVHRESRILVEIHARLTDNPELLPWDFETLWNERAMVRIGDAQIPTLAPTRLPLYLCAHGARHCWARLIWLEDMAATLGSREAIDRALADARSIGLEPLLLDALRILHNWFGHPVPAELLARARASKRMRALDAIIVWFHRDPRWFEPPARGSWRRFRQGSIQERIATYLMKTGRRYWLRQLSKDLVSPADQRLFRLPPYLHWLYIPLRPAGWLLRRL